MKGSGTTISNENHNRLTDELERLSALHQQGLLNDEDFRKAKERLLSEPDSPRSLELLNWQIELAQIDREWVQEQETYKITRRYGQRTLPQSNSATGIFGAVIVIGFLLFGIAGVSQNGAPGYFMFFGVIMLVVILVSIATESSKRSDYDSAKARYEKQRTEHLQRKPR